MSFLANAGVVGIEPKVADFSIPNGPYPATITDSKIDEFNGKTKWQITYQIDPEVEEYGGRTVAEWFDLDPNLPENRKQFLVRRLSSLEITPEEQETLEPQDVIGTEVTITVKNKPSADGTRVYTNVTKVVLGKDQIAAGAAFLSKF